MKGIQWYFFIFCVRNLFFLPPPLRRLEEKKKFLFDEYTVM